MQKQPTTTTHSRKTIRTIGAGLDEGFAEIVDELHARGYNDTTIVRRGIRLLADHEQIGKQQIRPCKSA